MYPLLGDQYVIVTYNLHRPISSLSPKELCQEEAPAVSQPSASASDVESSYEEELVAMQKAVSQGFYTEILGFYRDQMGAYRGTWGLGFQVRGEGIRMI